MNNEFISKVFKFFGAGLLVTFLTAYAASTSEALLRIVYSSSTMWIIIIIEFVLAIMLSYRLDKISTTTASLLYFGYTITTGLTFASIFLVYQISSIIYIFLATAIIFFLFSYLGRILKLDLSKLSIYIFIALLSIIILSIVNIFLMNNTLDLALCAISIIIFVIYVAYDVQKIIRLSEYTSSDNYAIMGAFQLYLDFINIFINLLRIFGKDRD